VSSRPPRRGSAIAPVTSKLARYPGGSALGAGVIALVVALPLLGLLAAWRAPALDIWAHLWRTQLPGVLWNTLTLLAGVGTGSIVLGTTLAWLVAAYRFPGSRLFAWALVLPLALPAYVMGFVLLGIFDYAGPLQTFVRQTAGVTLPDIRGWAGVTVTMSFVFYPYVYVLARAAFQEQASSLMEAARSLGHSRPRAFLAIALPLARPAVVAGGALAMMEALADLGTVSLFGHRTLTETVYRTWAGMFDRIAATQLASLLLLGAFALLTLERISRGHRHFVNRPRGGRRLVTVTLQGGWALAATATCATVLALAFVLPVGQLVVWTWRRGIDARLARTFAGLLVDTAWLAGVAAIVISAVGLAMAYARRLDRSRVTQIVTDFSAMGYAVPGAVIAVGVLAPLAYADRALAAALRMAGGPVEIFLTGSIVGILFAYLVRFLAVALQGIDAALGRIPRSMDEAARSLGVAGHHLLRRVHLPLLRGGITATLLLLWVETMKELPATLLLRPIGLKTLAIEIWERTSESMWEEAALPALALVVVGLIPLLLVTRLTRKTE
jgi:iron(III) transport system permease protein